MDAPAGVTQEEGHTGFLHLPSAMPALIFIARRIQPSLSLAYPVLVGRKNLSSCDCTEIRTHVPTSEDLEVIN